VISVGDRHCFDAVPDPNFHVNVDPDPDCHQNDADPLADPTQRFLFRDPERKITKILAKPLLNVI
jgi:hypothetical protein